MTNKATPQPPSRITYFSITALLPIEWATPSQISNRSRRKFNIGYSTWSKLTVYIFGFNSLKKTSFFFSWFSKRGLAFMELSRSIVYIDWGNTIKKNYSFAYFKVYSFTLRYRSIKLIKSEKIWFLWFSCFCFIFLL